MTLQPDLVYAALHGQPGQSSQDERDEVDPELRSRSSQLGPVRVSGLKSDSPRRIGIAGGAPTGLRAQERAVCRNRRPTAAAGERPTFCRLAEGLRFGRTRNRPAKQSVFLETTDDRPAASPVSVRPDADAQADCRHAKDLQMQVFCKAAEGIRTLDLLHGKQYLWRRLRTNMPANKQFSAARA